MFTFATAGVLTFPALSVQVPDAIWPAPSLLNVIGEEQKAMPERLSVPLKETVTFELFQPLAFAEGTALAFAVGGVWSILTVTDAELVSPAPFVAEHVKVVPAVSVVRVAAPHPVEEAIPD
jgi:hypothetical protein